MKKFVLPQLAASLAPLRATVQPYYHTDQRTSRRNLPSLAMQPSLPRILILLCLLLVSGGAGAADYVIKSGNYYIGMNAAGTALEAKTSFDESCIWTTANALSTTSQSVQNKKNTGKCLTASCSRSGYYNYTYSWTLTADNATAVWRGDGGNFYARCSGTTWNREASITVAANGTISLADNDTDNSQYYQVTITECPALSQITGIDGADAIGKAGTYDYTKIGDAKVYSSTYMSYAFNGLTYYKVGDNITATAPTGEEFTYTWSATCSDASYTDYSFSDGTLTITATPETDKEITITLTATKDGQQTQTVTKVVNVSNRMPTGIDGEVVTLNDYEDHNWAYYKGLDYTITNPDGSTISYKDKYRYSIYSPDPRNVKITYRGYDTTNSTIDLGGTSKVGIGTLNNNTAPHVSNVEGEGQNTFVYYETLEKFVIGFFEQHKTGDDYDGTPANPNNVNEQYPYTVISNPFSVRPSTGSGDSKKYYGFAGWKIISGGDKILEYNNNDVIPLDAVIHFTNLGTEAAGTYTPNCTSAEVVLEATWAQATISTDGLTNSGGTRYAPTFSGGTYETNFWVMPTVNNNFYVNSPCTIIGMYPDGTSDNSTTRTISNNLTVNTSGTTPKDNTVKVEWIRHGDVTFNANGKNMILGRGITSSSGSNQGNVYNCTSNIKCVNTVKVESGYYTNCRPTTASNNSPAISATNDLNAYIIFGCDYDRARADYFDDSNTYNTKLQISGLGWTGLTTLNRSGGELYVRSLFKSGVIYGQFYGHRPDSKGQRFVTIEGGYFKADIRGGSEVDNEQPNARAYTLRGKGNFRVDQQIAGGSNSRHCQGDRCIVLTGGNVAGWIAAGSSCNSDGGGITTGETFVYIGGNAQIDSNGNTDLINNSSGGVVYGAGCGYGSNSSSGRVEYGTNVILADNAYVERGIYGGGAMGRLPEGQASNIFVFGGHVGTGEGTINDHIDENNEVEVSVSKSGVFGGACNVGGGYSNIYMNGGIVEGGVFGGSNISGTMDNNVRIQIDGGQVGTTTVPANVHGGGYGSATRVLGSVNVEVGEIDESGKVSGDAVIYGDVYGGSAEGKTNGDNSLTSGATTTVTLNSGAINGSLYGGGLGTSGTNGYAADVYGPVTVTVNGGKVLGESSAVYGCNNVKGAPQNTVSVTVNHTGSHNAGSDVDDPADDIYAINAVYGGGNQAAYTYGIPTVTVNNCDNSIQYVYGGGNQATVPATNVTINGGNIIGNVFGGGNNANVTGTATGVTLTDGDTGNKGTRVNINGGRILNVYGGNNNGGSITGMIKVNVAEPAGATCPVNVTDLYGGGNLAASNAGKITIGKCSNISNVYGGANQANVTGPITLNIVDGNIGTVFGGNNNSGTITGAITVNVNWNGSAKDNESDTSTRRSLGSVYGGGNKAPYTGNPTVNFTKGITSGSVFGGGLGKDAIVTGNPTVNIGDWATKDDVIIGGDVFGGGDLAAVEGNPSVTVRECGTIIEGDLYGGGNAAPVYSTNTTVWGGNIKGNVFGGGNGVDRTKNEHGAQVGYKSGDTETGGSGNTVTNIYGGTIGTWTTDSSTGVSTCQDDTGGIFGGSNTNGNIRGTITLCLDEKKSTDSGAEQCSLTLKEVYGAGNQAAYAGSGITFTLGCVSVLGEIYGGAKQADLNGDVHLKITSGHFDRVCGGNNLGGKLNGSIKVTVDETGCTPVTIDELYGGGNQAAYSIYGYNEDGTLKTSGENPKADPEVNIVSCTSIGQVFGGGLGSTAVMAGNPKVNINMIEGAFSNAINNKWNNKLGTIDNVYGGGNAAKVVGDTHVNIGTKTTVLRADGTTNATVEGVNISGNVYGGGNQADVTGKTHVQVGAEPATTTP